MDRVADRWEAFPALGRALGGVDEAAAEKGAEGEDPRRDHIMDAATTEEGEAGDPRAGEMMEAASAAVGESESVPVPSTWEVGADLASPPGIAASEDSSKGEGEVAISPASESAADGERMSPASIPAEHDDGWWSEARADALAEEDAAQAIVGPGPAAVAAVESSASEWRDEEPILGEAEPEDEIALSGQAGFAMDLERLDRIATGALPSMAEPARLLEVAERLERIARTLREHGTTAPLVAQGQDPLGALITGYVLGYFEGAHARAPDRSG